MCGIVGYIGRNRAGSVMLDGLKRLEYRGYDSSGMVVATKNGFEQIKRVGRVKNLEDALEEYQFAGNLGISHTRWATHGGVTEANAHPHRSSDGLISLVHNGVIENYIVLRKFLISEGYQFTSETDSEALVNLIAYHYKKEPKTEGKNALQEAVRKSLRHVEGTYGIAVISPEHPDTLIGLAKARH